MKQFGTVLKAHAVWATKKFPLVSAQHSLDHAKEELDELKTDIANGDKPLAAVEAADVIACVITAITKAGITVEELQAAFENKLAINKKRKWRFDEKLGYYKHVVKKEVVKKD